MQISDTSLQQLPSHAPQPATKDTDARLMTVAKDLEATFLSEMLKHAGVGQLPDSFGGGIGEEQFSSLLREAQAKGIVENGGIGLAESIFQSLKESTDEK